MDKHLDARRRLRPHRRAPSLRITAAQCKDDQARRGPLMQSDGSPRHRQRPGVSSRLVNLSKLGLRLGESPPGCIVVLRPLRGLRSLFVDSSMFQACLQDAIASDDRLVCATCGVCLRNLALTAILKRHGP